MWIKPLSEPWLVIQIVYIMCLVVWPWANDFTCLPLSFLIYKMRGLRLSVRALPTPTFCNYVIRLQFSSMAVRVTVNFSLPLSFLPRVLQLNCQFIMALFQVRYVKLPRSATQDRNKDNSWFGFSVYACMKKSDSSKVSYSKKANLLRHVT